MWCFVFLFFLSDRGGDGAPDEIWNFNELEFSQEITVHPPRRGFLYCDFFLKPFDFSATSVAA